MARIKVRDIEAEENKGPVKRFFGTVLDHFTTLVGVNFLYAVFNIPMMLLAFAFVLFFLPMANPLFVPENFYAFMSDAGIVAAEGTNGLEQLYYIITVLCAMILMGTGLLCIGPFQAGFSQVYRNIYRRKEVSLWYDFKTGMKKNWKQSLAASIVSIPVTAIILFAIAYYSNIQSTFGTIMSTLFTVIFFIFIAMQNFVHQQIVSIDLPLSAMYKNAWLFVLLKFGPCLGMTGVLVVALMIVPFAMVISTTAFGYGLAVIWFLGVVIWLVQYMYAFATGEFINQYVAAKKETPKVEGEESENGDAPDNEESEDPDEDTEDEDSSDETSEDNDSSEEENADNAGENGSDDMNDPDTEDKQDTGA